jgi:6-bladed beta-propeller
MRIQNHPAKTMSSTYKPLLLCALLSLLACKKEETNLDGALKVTVFDQASKDPSLESSIDRIETVALKAPTDVQVSICSKLLMHEGEYYILDNPQSKIFKFNSKGEYLSNFPRTGDGPGEVTDLIDFQIDEKEKHLLLYDRGKGMLIYTDLNGKYLKQTRVSPLPRNFELGTGNQLIWYYSNNSLPGDRLYNITVNDQQGTVLSRHLEYYGENAITTSFGGVFAKNEQGELLCSNGISNTIWSMSRSPNNEGMALEKKYHFDFGRYSIPNEDKEVSAFISKNLASEEVSYLTKCFIELPNGLTFFSFFHKLQISAGLLNRKNGKLLIGRDFKNECLGKLLAFANQQDNNALVVVQTGEEFSYLAKNVQECINLKEEIVPENMYVVFIHFKNVTI